MDDDAIYETLTLFKALADESRLRIVGLLAGGERTVDDLAAALGLRPPTVSHHLSKLKEAGLASMRAQGTSHVYRLETERLRRLAREALAPGRLAAIVSDSGEAWERKVLRDFSEDGRLREIPASLKKRQAIVRWLARQFEPGRQYSEAEVNDLIGRYHPDFATLRRELIGMHLLEREAGIYRVT
jgi:DNA-binding transcriptional ArsR family regulator